MTDTPPFTPALPSQSTPTPDPSGGTDAAEGAGPSTPAGTPGQPAPRGPVDVAALAAAVRSIERGESPAAPAPRGDAAEARRKQREAMAAEAAALQAAEVAAAELPAPGAEGAEAVAAEVEQTPAVERAPVPPKLRILQKRAVAVDPAAVEDARRVLLGGGAPGELAEEAVRALGERAGEALREDPWGVLGLSGVRVEHADAFARALLGAQCGPGDERRGRALVAHLMEKATWAGHTALAAEDLKADLARHAVPDPAAAVAAAADDGRLLVFRTDAEPPDQDEGDEGDDAAENEGVDVPLLLGLDRYALAEESLADGLVRLIRSFESGEPPQSADTAAWEKAAAEAPSPSAAELIRAAAGSGLVVHSGGEASRAEPAALVTAARAAGLRAYAAAYTENGRRRLAASVGEDAALTVAGLLDGGGDGGGPGRAEDGSLALDLLAVLDAPQLSVEEATDLVEAVPDGARLVLSGDPSALWSAGPGRAFADLRAARVCPRVTSRTPDPGPIGELTSCVGIGELTAVEAPDREVVVVPVRDPGEALHRTVQLVADSVPRAIGVPPEQTQVIALAHGGPVGTRALNAALKERLNPGPGRFAGFDPGDRVVHVPSPGHTMPGTVAGAAADGLRLECERGTVLVPREDVPDRLRHGWAITGHQAAGMRWPAVVVVVPGDAGPLLTRSWVYTAFTRAERHLSVVQGADQHLAEAIAGPAAKDRTTRLTGVLRELAADA